MFELEGCSVETPLWWVLLVLFVITDFHCPGSSMSIIKLIEFLGQGVNLFEPMEKLVFVFGQLDILLEKYEFYKLDYKSRSIGLCGDVVLEGLEFPSLCG